MARPDRRRRRVIVPFGIPKILLAAAVVLLAAIGIVGTTRYTSRARSGHDLTVVSLQSAGVVGYNTAHRNTIYRFAFPIPRNKSGHSIQLTGASLQSIPTGIQVLGYPIYSLAEVGGNLLSDTDSGGSSSDLFRTRKDYAPAGVAIAAHSDSNYLVMVAVRVTGSGDHTLSGCRFTYTRDNHAYTQTFRCEFQLGDPG